MVSLSAKASAPSELPRDPCARLLEAQQIIDRTSTVGTTSALKFGDLKQLAAVVTDRSIPGALRLQAAGGILSMSKALSDNSILINLIRGWDRIRLNEPELSAEFDRVLSRILNQVSMKTTRKEDLIQALADLRSGHPNKHNLDYLIETLRLPQNFGPLET
jgi:hypothetical protein